MDYYMRKMQQAQCCADRVVLFSKNNFMQLIGPEPVPLDADAWVPDIRHWARLKGFRLKADEAHSEQAMRQAVFQWMNSAGGSAAFAVIKKDRDLSVLYGSADRAGESAFLQNLPECRIEQDAWSPPRCPWAGMVLGTVSAQGLSDAIASSGELHSCYAACVAISVPDDEIQQMLEENRQLLAALEPCKSIQRIYGSATRRTEELPVRNVQEAMALLQEESRFLNRWQGSGFVRTVVRFGASTGREFRALQEILRGCLVNDLDGQNTFEPVRFYKVSEKDPSVDGTLAVPAVRLQSDVYSGAVHPLTLQTVNNTVSFCVPPINSCPGYYLKNYHIDENSRDVFPAAESVTDAGVEVGHIMETGAPAMIPFNALYAHTAVFGATNTGKTTTVKRILQQASLYKIPFTVIEAAKKEYAGLLSQVPDLQVYTPGLDGIPLQLNPLQPEDGVLIETQVEAVTRALTASTGGEHPIPEAYQGLLKQTYEKFGWKYGMPAYRDPARPFPTFSDAVKEVDSYIAAHARYGPEVRQNMTAALTLRTQTMASGALGALFSQREGLTAKELLAAPSVIELADFSESSAAFLMNILLFKIHSYLSRQPETNELKRLIVVEEAHNVFRKTAEEFGSRAENNRFFEKMLAEIRSSGTGLIISTQRPAVLSDAVIANTAVKVLHGLTDRDRKQAAEAIGLSDYQTKKLQELKTGQCIIALRGRYGVQHTQVSAAEQQGTFHAGCLICRSRHRCRRQVVRQMLAGMAPEQLAFHAARIQANPYDTKLLARNISSMLRDLDITASDTTKCCLLGELLEQYGAASFQNKRIIVKSYFDFLRGEKH